MSFSLVSIAVSDVPHALREFNIISDVFTRSTHLMTYVLNAMRDLRYVTHVVTRSSFTWCSLLRYTESEVEAATEVNYSHFAIFNIDGQLAPAVYSI